jgi:hypothetical protein
LRPSAKTTAQKSQKNPEKIFLRFVNFFASGSKNCAWRDVMFGWLFFHAFAVITFLDEARLIKLEHGAQRFTVAD